MTDIRTGRTLCLAVASLAAAVGFARDFDVRPFGAAGDGASDDIGYGGLDHVLPRERR